MIIVRAGQRERETLMEESQALVAEVEKEIGPCNENKPNAAQPSTNRVTGDSLSQFNLLSRNSACHLYRFSTSRRIGFLSLRDRNFSVQIFV
jgi:hypothetical protein